jgi:Zn-dependent protease with chaperone function
MKYSRRFEFEADDYAAAVLPRIGVAQDRLAAILQRLERMAGPRQEGGSSAAEDVLLDYVSTHPATKERVRRLTERAR